MEEEGGEGGRAGSARLGKKEREREKRPLFGRRRRNGGARIHTEEEERQKFLAPTSPSPLPPLFFCVFQMGKGREERGERLLRFCPFFLLLREGPFPVGQNNLLVSEMDDFSFHLVNTAGHFTSH